MANQRKNPFSSFWTYAFIASIVGFIRLGEVFWLYFCAFSALMIVIGLFDKVKAKSTDGNTNHGAGEEVKNTIYPFDFDALSSSHKTQLLKQQFGYFFRYRNVGSSGLEFYCAEDELDGYRFSFWVEYLVENTYSSQTVRVKKGDLICIVHISSSQGTAYRYESSTISASVDGVVTGLLKGVLQKNSVLFRIKEEKQKEYEEAKVVATVEVNEVQEISQAQTISFEDTMKELDVENENIEVEKLDDVLKWEMPSVDDIEMPEEEEDNSVFDASVAYHATIANLSDFDWFKFKAVCYSSKDKAQTEVKRIGNVKIGTKTLLSSRYDMFYLEGENERGEQKRFRPFTLEKDSDITVTTIFIEHD